MNRPIRRSSHISGINAGQPVQRKYAAYKDSGVPWLGQVPEHWGVKRNKLFMRELNERSADGTEELLTVSQYTGVTARRERLSDEGELLTNAASLVGYKHVQPGDLVMNIMLAWNGSLGVSSLEGIASPAYCVFRANACAEPRFLHYLLRTPLFTGVFKTVSTGVVDSRLRLYPDVFFRLPSLLPTLPEQVAIVRFLDHAERCIRRYVRAKQKLIKLLEEQKQVIIHRAVTRGLDATVRLKPSGVEWFPETPEHWEVLPMRRVILRSVDGPHHSPEYHDSGVPFLSARNIKVESWSLDDAKFISESDYNEFCKRVTPEIGDVLYTKGGTTGVARVVDLDFKFQVWVHVAVLKLNARKIRPDFLAAALNSPRCYEQSQLFTRGATNQDLGLGRMKDIVLPVPPIADQEGIMVFLNIATSSLRGLIHRAHREIFLLRGYRTRLITDVVTGKLDVREAAAKLPDETPEAGPLDEIEDVSQDDAEAEDIDTEAADAA